MIPRTILSAKLRLRELAAVEWTPKTKAVWRHYFKKAKKQMRGGKFGGDMEGYMPDHPRASRFGLMWRGASKSEVQELGNKGRFVSSFTPRPGKWPKSQRTYVAGNPSIPESYALSPVAFRNAPLKDARIYGISPTALKRSDKKLRPAISDMPIQWARTAPIRGGIAAKEVRVILKPHEGVQNELSKALTLPLDQNEAKRAAYLTAATKRPGVGLIGNQVRWRPVPLGEVMRKDFESAKLRLRELAGRMDAVKVALVD